MDSVLVACPTYAGKEYCLDEWIGAYNSFAHQDKGSLMVDNTRDSDGYTKLILSKGIFAVHVDPFPTFNATMLLCWQIIHQEAVLEGYDWIFSLEADTIPRDPMAIDTLLGVAHAGKTLNLVTHTYPFHMSAAEANGMLTGRNKNRLVYNELGCTLISTRLLGLALADVSRYQNFTQSLFMSATRYLLGWASCCHAFKVDHLDGYDMEFGQFIKEENDGRQEPCGIPAEMYGQQVPPSIAEDYIKMERADPPGEVKQGAGKGVVTWNKKFTATASGTKIPGEKPKRVRQPKKAETKE